MKTTTKTCIHAVRLTLLCFALSACTGNRGSWVSLRTDTYTLTQPRDDRRGFSLTTRLDITPPTADTTLLSIPGLLSITLRQHDPADARRQNYPASPMPDGTVPVLEASLTLLLPDSSTLARQAPSPQRQMCIGLPLAALRQPYGAHTIVLNYTEATWDIYVDGRLMDRDYPIGQPPVDPLTLTQDSVEGTPAYTISAAVEPQPLDPPTPNPCRQIQYFTPTGHNTWVGDVATIWHDGRYHVFYLLDRRGHESKFGQGGHYFEHLSTTDLRHWTEHEAAAPIEQQWETLGTGTPFIHHDTLCLSYGMHTSRLYPDSLTATPTQWLHIRNHGTTVTQTFDHQHTTDGRIPSGATYSISTDGIARFRKSHRIIHPAENPTIYTDQDGNLRMLANYRAQGTWVSPRIDGPWTCLSPDFPPGGDCTFIFTWNDYEYIVGGFTHHWMRHRNEPAQAWHDLVGEGRDLYDGLSVPSISQFGTNGRHFLAGWVETNQHWGGPLVIRELIQHPDGILGTRFIPELMPVPIGKKQKGTEATRLIPGRNYLVTLKAKPQRNGILTIDFASDDTTQTCRWTLDIAKKTARFADGKTLRDGGAPHKATDYAIENLRGLDRTFPVRIILRSEPKLGGTLVDIEIASQRTMISHRAGLRISHIDIRHDNMETTSLTTQETL